MNHLYIAPLQCQSLIIRSLGLHHQAQLSLESPQEAVPPSSDIHPVPQDTPEALADESIAEPASPPHDIVSEEKSTAAPLTLTITDVKNILSPHV